MEKLKILVSAYAFHPRAPKWIGHRSGYTSWKLVEQLVRFCDVWVMTTNQNRDPVLESLSEGGLPEARIRFVNLPKFHKFLRRSFSGQYLCYFLWQRSALEEARALHSEHQFDAAHHLTPGPEWFPSFLGASLPIPFIWGPLLEDEGIPKSLRRFQSNRLNIKKSWEQTVQRWARRRHARKKCAQNSRAILVSDPDTVEKFPKVDRKKIHFFPSYGIDAVSSLSKMKSSREKNVFRAIGAGNLTRESGFFEIIRAFRRFVQSHPEADFALFGNGPEKNRLERQILRMDRQGRIRIHPPNEMESMRKEMHDSDVFICPVVSQDESVWVIEAMAAGLPVIGVDFGGRGMHIQDKWGVKVTPGSSKDMQKDIVHALEMLYKNPKTRLKMGRAAQKNAKENYVWERLGNKLKRIYGEALLQDEDIRFSRKGEERFFY